MIKTRSLYFLVFAILIASFKTHSQEDSLHDNLSFELPSSTEKCDIYLSGSRRVTEVSLGKLLDTTVNIYKDGFSKSINISEIKRVTFKNHAFWTGAAVGFAASVVFWGVYGLMLNHHGHPDFFGGGGGFLVGLVLGVPIGLVSGMVAEFVTADDTYNFKGNNTNAKTKRLKYIMQKHRK